MFVLSIIALVLAVIAFIISIAISRNREYAEGVKPARAVAIVLTILTVLFAGFSMTTMVGTRDIGVVTSFGRPVKHLDNGLHLKAPWQKVSTLDGAIQTDNFVGKNGCTEIRIGNESTACVDNSIRWRINPAAGDELFKDYHTMTNIKDSLVTRELKAALNEALANYNPLDEIQANQQGAKPNLSAFQTTVAKAMRDQIGSQIDVLSVIIPIIRFDDSTQQKINAYQAEVANTRIAQQREQTAEAQSKANRILSKSVSDDPNVLVSKCLDTVDEAVKSNVQLPAGYSCWPGGQSSVVIPSGTSSSGKTSGKK